MTRSHELKFPTPSLTRRLGGMLGVDFYRLFHTPMLYIFLGIAAIIPAMVLGMTTTADGTAPLYGNTWNVIAADMPLYVVRDIGDYANMNMVFIFGGIMVSIFIGHDYQSGYVKQLFTTHSRKVDYMLSKTLTCAFAMACMCVSYLLGALAGGIFAGADWDVPVGSLVLAILGKMLMSLGWASFYTLLNVIFRKKFGIAIAASFFFGTGIPVIGAAAVVGNTPVLNLFLYGSSVNACLGSDLGMLTVCMSVSVLWALVCTLMGTLILSHSDVY